MLLLIHHHSPVFRRDGGIYVQSFIGAWVDALAPHFDEIGLLFFETNDLQESQDHRICAPNVKVHSLGERYPRSRSSRRRALAQRCEEIAGRYDSLLIRGITPRQMAISEACDVRCRSFFLVGSIVDSRPSLRFSLRSWLLRLLYHLRVSEVRRIAKDASVFCNSPATVAELGSIMGISAEFVPTNTIGDLDILPFCFQRPNSIRRLLYCGRVVPDKGIEELIQALGRIREGGLMCNLEIIGNVDLDYRKHLEHLAELTGVAEHIDYRGYIGFGSTLLERYRSADCFVLPSWHEGFPHAIWEAASCGTPIVVTPVGGIPGIVTDQEVRFVQVKSVKSLVEGIVDTLVNSEQASERANKVYELAGRYTVESCAKVLAQHLSQDEVFKRQEK